MTYRWAYPRKPTADQRDGAPIRIPVCAESGGSMLVVEMDSAHTANCVRQFAYQVTPQSVADWIRQARRDGWCPAERGPQHRLRVEARTTLKRVAPRGALTLSQEVARSLDVGPFNQLSVARGPAGWHPVVDGVGLIELVTAAEFGHVQRESQSRDLAPAAGDYGPWSLLDADTYLGSLDAGESEPRHKVEFADCSCGNLGCWPLVASVYSFDSHVVWADFEQLHRDWILALGPYVFERAAYERVLSPMM